jgi:glycosyltransferase involved in cell wall biosynthesis
MNENKTTLKVLHIVPSYKPAYVYGGTIESVARLCEGTVNAGIDVKVLTTTANGASELDVTPGKEYIVDGVPVIYFKRIFKDPYYISPALWRKLYRECKHYDVVHIHSWWNMIVIVAAFICRAKKVKTIFSPHGMLSDYILQNSKSSLKKIIHAIGGKKVLTTMRFHATSNDEYTTCKNFIQDWAGFMIPNIVWLPSLEICKTSNPVFTIIFLSRIHPKKGIELLMEAISKFPEKPLLKLAGTGEENYIEKLKQYAEARGINETTEWLGWQDREQKFNVLMHADLFALTSYNENFGNVVIESLYAATPVLISREVGLHSFVEEHGLGWICSTDVNDIFQTLKAAMNDKEKTVHVASTASTLVKDIFSEESLVPQYLHEYFVEEKFRS